MIQDYSTVSLVLSGIMPCVDPVDYAELFCLRRDVSTFQGVSESRAKTLLSVALAGGSQEMEWRDLIDEVDAFVRAEGLHGRPVQRLQSLLKVCDPDGDGWVVTIAILVSIYMELRRLPIDQGIDMWEALHSYRNRGAAGHPRERQEAMRQGVDRVRLRTPARVRRLPLAKDGVQRHRSSPGSCERPVSDRHRRAGDVRRSGRVAGGSQAPCAGPHSLRRVSHIPRPSRAARHDLAGRRRRVPGRRAEGHSGSQRGAPTGS
jgi:hypothetical protein